MRIKKKVEEPKRPAKLKDVVGRDLIEIYTDDSGDRYVWFLGYGVRDRSSELGFRWYHFLYNIVPLDLFMQDESMTSESANHLFNHDEPPKEEEINKWDMRYYYSDADTEEATPFFEWGNEIKDGYYILQGA